MSIPEIVQLGREFTLLTLLLVAPPVMASLLVGLLISIFQTVTSIQEQTLSFAPRIVAVGIVMAWTLPWSLELAADFTQRVLVQIAEIHR